MLICSYIQKLTHQMVDRLVAFLVEAHLSASGFPQKGGLGLSSAVLSTNIRFSKDFPLPSLCKWRSSQYILQQEIKQAYHYILEIFHLFVSETMSEVEISGQLLS